MIPRLGRSPGEGNGNPLQYSCLENSIVVGYSPWDPKELDMTEQLHWHIWKFLRKQVRTGHGTTEWSQIGKGVHQGCISSPCLFNLYAEYIMRNAGLEEAQAGIKIAGRNINNLRYADDTALMAESEKLKDHLMK